MSNLSKLEFVTLDISGKNYLSWVLDAEIHLTAKGLGDSIIEENTTSNQDKAKSVIFLRHHLDESLKVEYLTVKEPLELWIGLKGRYDHLKATILSRARYEWMHLRFQDYKIIIEYNSVHNDILMKNYEAQLAGSAPLPEAHAVEAHVEIMQQDEDFEPRSVSECRQRNDWLKWKEAIQTELASLEKCEVFGSIVRTPEGIKPMGHK
ncbi:uncharacterized protein [Solanum lycopersicum]|uniref:uncharacterized protein n=1 Tax=Solanum lycopersicum TaxID=4081 RepID=UPI0037478595